MPNNTNNDPVPLAYGINADIAGTVVDGMARLGGDPLGVYGGPNAPGGYFGVPNIGESTNNKLTPVRNSAAVVLFGDWGTIREAPFQGNFADWANLLAITTTFHNADANVEPENLGTLAGLAQTGWLAWKMPFNRHDNDGQNANGKDDISGQEGGKLNMSFVDGHGETVTRTTLDGVQVSPFKRGA